MISKSDIHGCLEALRTGGLILYPTDTIWGIGCDARDADAVARVYALKARPDSKSLIILLPDWEAVRKFVNQPDPAAREHLEATDRPTTVIFRGAQELAPNAVAEDGSIAIRIPRNDFLQQLLKEFGGPLVSTSANVSGVNFSGSFMDIAEKIRQGVDFVAESRRNEEIKAVPSRILFWEGGGRMRVIRE